MKKTILKWCLLVLLLAYATAITVWAGHEAGTRKCTGIKIEVENAMTPQSDSITRIGVQYALDKYDRSIIGQPLIKLNIQHLENYLRQLKNLEDVECVLTSDRKVKITVSPMIPELRVFAGNKSWYVNKDGKTVEARPEFYADVPLATGKFSRTFQPAAILPIAKFIRNDEEMRELVAMIEAQDPNNIILVPRINGHVINFGDTSRLAEKKKNLLAFYKKVMPYKGWNTYDTISVRFKNQIVATRRNKTTGPLTATYDEHLDPEEAALQEINNIQTKPDSIQH